MAAFVSTELTRPIAHKLLAYSAALSSNSKSFLYHHPSFYQKLLFIDVQEKKNWVKNPNVCILSSRATSRRCVFFVLIIACLMSKVTCWIQPILSTVHTMSQCVPVVFYDWIAVREYFFLCFKFVREYFFLCFTNVT